jgi:hypothetical protein
LIYVNAPRLYCPNLFFNPENPEDDQMSKHSAIHFYLSWAKERMDEMDATLASLEGKISEVHADARAKANQALSDMKKSAMTSVIL